MTQHRLILLLLFTFVSCQPASEEQIAAERFLRYLSRGDYTKAQEYVHPASLPLMVDFENLGVSSDTMRARPVQWSIDSIRKYGKDSAWVYFTWNQLPEKMLMVKEKKSWKVVF